MPYSKVQGIWHRDIFDLHSGIIEEILRRDGVEDHVWMCVGRMDDLCRRNVDSAKAIVIMDLVFY